MNNPPIKLSILVPSYNEEASIGKLLERLFALSLDKEIIVVDDGSTDNTQSILNNYPILKVILHEKNRGKGAAIRTALEHATGELIVIQDGDLEYDPQDLITMKEYLLSHDLQVLYGSRVLGHAPWSGVGFYLGGRFLSWLANILYGSSITDEPTCYKMFRRELITSMNLQCTRFEFCPEVTANTLRMGYEIKEIPISYRPRSVSEGKKIRFRDGISAIWILLKHRFLPMRKIMKDSSQK
ncbi:MAG: glycosyltransferase family 2 protein [bacterium]